MQQKINEKTFEGQSIYVGIDVHKKDWIVAIMTAEVSGKQVVYLRVWGPACRQAGSIPSFGT